MKILNKYILGSVFKVFLVTLFMFVLLVLSVDLFSNIDSYIKNAVPLINILQITLLYAPEAMMLVLPPSILFSVTFFLSQLYSNNEMIALLSSGISNKKVITPIIILGIIFTIFFFLFNEGISLEAKVNRASLQKVLFNQNSSDLNNSNITMKDSKSKYVIYSSYYKEAEKKLISVILVKQDINNKILYRVDAPEASWNIENQDWVFDNAIISTIVGDNEKIIQTNQSKFEKEEINLDPNLFRNLTNDINTLQLNSAFSYLKQQKIYDKVSWYTNATEFYDRLFNSLTAFVMICIAISINYRNKRNVFLFAIFNSIVIAVVYYVAKMLFQIMSRQGVIEPISSVLIPYLIVALFTLLTNFSTRNSD
ncbi:MAG: LptF/LptG family permease [Spirochaetaceae bacterium]|nr:LptF/LptG family permease [Spirochaetaceae bacterium]